MSSRAPQTCPTACIPACTGQECGPPHFSFSFTGAFTVLLRADHPPAGATTLIVSLGIISKPKELVIIEIAVFPLVGKPSSSIAWRGLPYPLWKYHAFVAGGGDGEDRDLSLNLVPTSQCWVQSSGIMLSAKKPTSSRHRGIKKHTLHEAK